MQQKVQQPSGPSAPPQPRSSRKVDANEPLEWLVHNLAQSFVVEPVKLLGKGLWWLVRRPLVALGLVLTVVGSFASAMLVAVVLLVAVMILMALQIRRPGALRRVVRERQRRMLYTARWRKTMTLCGLTKTYET